MIRISTCFCALLLASLSYSAPAGSSDYSDVASPDYAAPPAYGTSGGIPASAVTSYETATSDVVPPSETVPTIKLTPNYMLWTEDMEGTPEPVIGSLGATIIGPTSNIAIDKQNADLLAPPTTDHGSFPNAKWPFSLGHNRVQSGGWARQENIDVLPIGTDMAGVNMRLEAGAVREMHWHKTAEWAYVLKGTVQVSSIDQNGKNFIANVGPGDLWYFPAGIPHALQATDDDPDGAEFILVFDSGDFSEDSTLALTDWMAHTPLEVLAKNFGLDMEDFKTIPSQPLYIFPAEPPEASYGPESPQGTVPEPFAFRLSKVKPTKFNGGSVRRVDSTTFKISKTIAAAEVTIEPGAIRELHWHPTEDEWSFFIEGTARVTIFAGQGNARTFDYQAGDIGYVPASMGHYVENTGNSTLKFLEIFRNDAFQDVSLSQWIALTPPELVKAHLGFSDEIIAKLIKDQTKQVIVGA